MRCSFVCKVLLAAAVAIAAFDSEAMAHVGDHSHMSVLQGMAHFYSGIDHVLVLVAGMAVLLAGLWAWRTRPAAALLARRDAARKDQRLDDDRHRP